MSAKKINWREILKAMTVYNRNKHKISPSNYDHDLISLVATAMKRRKP